MKRTPFKRKRVQFKHGRPIARPRKSIDPQLRKLVWERDEGRCVASGVPIPLDGFECHHRKLRSQGGQDSACNLISLSSEAHRRIHDAPAKSRQDGYIVSREHDPLATPVKSWTGKMAYLSPNGTVDYNERN